MRKAGAENVRRKCMGNDRLPMLGNRPAFISGIAFNYKQPVNRPAATQLPGRLNVSPYLMPPWKPRSFRGCSRLRSLALHHYNRVLRDEQHVGTCAALKDVPGS